MSGPVSTTDAEPVSAVEHHHEPANVEVLPSRETVVGLLRVRRALPRRGQRTVGAWCFADHMGPAEVTPDRSIDIGPHPHIGLQTVTWLVEGEILHRDSLGSEQVVRTGQLNLMTAGHGVSHSEEATGRYGGPLHGIQLWVAQPEATRHGPPAFEHHAELPRVELGGAVATVFVGELAGAVSPARRDTDHVGIELDLRAGDVEVPLRPDYEYALVVLGGRVRVADTPVVPGQLANLGIGHTSLPLRATEPTRAVLLGGVPFQDRILMWWNFVARDTAEVDEARAAWQARHERFGTVASALPRLEAPLPPWAPQGEA